MVRVMPGATVCVLDAYAAPWVVSLAGRLVVVCVLMVVPFGGVWLWCCVVREAVAEAGPSCCCGPSGRWLAVEVARDMDRAVVDVASGDL